MEGSCEYILNKQQRTAHRGWYSSWGFGEVLTTPNKMALLRKGCICLVPSYNLNNGRSGSGWEQVAGCCKHYNEHSGSIECGEFLDYLRTG